MFSYDKECAFCKSNNIKDIDAEICSITCADCNVRTLYTYGKSKIASHHKTISAYRVHWMMEQKFHDTQTIITNPTNNSNIFSFNWLLPYDITLNRLDVLINMYKLLK
jgi:hypothetical protein